MDVIGAQQEIHHGGAANAHVDLGLAAVPPFEEQCGAHAVEEGAQQAQAFASQPAADEEDDESAECEEQALKEMEAGHGIAEEGKGQGVDAVEPRCLVIPGVDIGNAAMQDALPDVGEDALIATKRLGHDEEVEHKGQRQHGE